MSINKSALKRPNKDQVAEMAKALEESNKPAGRESNRDDRFWHPEVDSAGNGSAVIRFLPPKEEDSFPFVKVYDHGFQHNGSWYIENCPTTLANGTPCPACEANSALWNSGLESDKDVARSRKRRLKYVSNVLIIKDPAHPENEGKVKLFRYGLKIFEKIQECFNVDTDMGEEAFNPFGFFDGANFAIRIQTVAKFINYDKSKFIKTGDLYDGDEDKLTEVLDQMHSLTEFTDPSRFKSYEDLSNRLNKVLYGVKSAPSQNKVEDDDVPFEQSSPASEKFDTPKAEPAKQSKPESSEDDEDLEFFKKLVNS